MQDGVQGLRTPSGVQGAGAGNVGDLTKDEFIRQAREAFECARLESIRFDKQLRVDIDALVQRLRASLRSAERTLSLRALQTAKHWLGEDLAILGHANPYPNSKDPSNPIVDPATDCAPKFDEGAAAVAAGTRPYGDWDAQREAIAIGIAARKSEEKA